METVNKTIDPTRYTILIVDDVPANLAVVTDDLASRGFRIKIARTGESGLSIAQRSLPDLIVLDVRLPDIDGFEVCRRLKDNEKTREIPVIFMTVMGQTFEKVKGFGVGGVDYLTKPVQHQEVLARITTHLKLRELTRQLEDAKRQLEQRVMKRTAELAHANLSLKKEVDERRQIEVMLHHINRELRAVSSCNQVLIRAVDEQKLLDDICRIVCEEAGYPMAWVGYPQADAEKTIKPVAWSGDVDGYLSRANVTWADTRHGKGPCGIAARSGIAASIDNVAKDPASKSWREAAIQRGFNSIIALPLKDDKKQVTGVFTIYSGNVNAFPDDEKRLLKELADDLSFGITTLRKRAEHQQTQEQMRIAATAFEAQEGILITDADQIIQRVNQAFTAITGYTAVEVVGKTPHILKSNTHAPSYYQEMWENIHRSGSWQGEICNRRKNGELYSGWLIITAVKDNQGDVSHYVGTLTDITERKNAEAEIEFLAYHDPLTQLPNRRLLQYQLEHALAVGARKPSFGALLVIDLDNFKMLNDTRGHVVGDQLLVEVSHRLTGITRKKDTVARSGGDEFMLLLSDLGDNVREAANRSKKIVEKLLKELQHPYLIEEYEHHSTVSVGIALFNGAHSSLDDIIKQADIAMYQAKADGKNRLRFFDPDMEKVLAERTALEVALRRGIEEEQFVLYYQPQMDGMRNLIGVELLLRWNHPDRGLVAPGDFISLAEDSGLILPIGDWVLRMACSQLGKWEQQDNKSNFYVAVNISHYQFRQVDFVGRVKQILVEFEVPENRLKLELTESLLIEDVEGSIEKMNALRALGVVFSLDDFGTGYSSLSYLTRLPLEQLKIDMSFIRNLPHSYNDAVVVQTIITMAQSLGLSVIAEGVETEQQKDFLEDHGCTLFQGYLFSKPLPLVDFEKLIQ